ncbi:MAG: cob(I)yrinic acid a,c-diamide adenosyltransferase [Terriglobia bacterium]
MAHSKARAWLKRGLVQVYTGEGKGKTSAALGLGFRAVGSGLKVYMMQFMKASRTGELDAVRAHAPDFVIEQWRESEEGEQRVWQVRGATPTEARMLAEEAFARVRENVMNGLFDIIILDEINTAVHFELVSLRAVTDLVASKPVGVELVLTGQKAPEAIIDAADLVTEMVKVKHPYDRGIKGRPGIEF